MAGVMNQTLTRVATLTQIDCGKCGGIYAISSRLVANRREQGGGWHCPYCQCSWGYFGKTEAERERARAERAERSLEISRRDRERAERRASAYKGHYTRARKMVGAGQCPVPGCRRHFKNLASHMKRQHPVYTDADYVG